jgi:signal transduction histidine kinase
MTRGRVRLVVLSAVLCGAGAEILVLSSDREDATPLLAVLGPVIGWSFIGTGLYAWRRRPESRTGALMILLGFAWFYSALALSDTPLVFTVASVTAGLWGGVFLHLVVAFPSGRVAPGADRALVGAGYLLFTVGSIPVVLFAGAEQLGCAGCPENLLLIRRDAGLADVTLGVVALLHVVLFGLTLVRLTRRWRRARTLDRLQLTPVYVCGMGTFLIVTVARVGLEEAFWAAYLSTALLPFAFLAGLLRSHVSNLDAELRARVEELRASRARLVEAGDAERRRLERDLPMAPRARSVRHGGSRPGACGAVARSRASSPSPCSCARRGSALADPGVTALLDQAQAELQTGLAELRELARGIHPAVLSDRGLEPAVRALAARAPVPVEVDVDAFERLPPPVEIAAYFVVSEALANVARYADASAATVALRRTDGCIVVAVGDDGGGGADAARGSGLRGLADRVAALDGTLSLDSPPGRGTRLRAEIPVPAQQADAGSAAAGAGLAAAAH